MVHSSWHLRIICNPSSTQEVSPIHCMAQFLSIQGTFELFTASGRVTKCQVVVATRLRKEKALISIHIYQTEVFPIGNSPQPWTPALGVQRYMPTNHYFSHQRWENSSDHQRHIFQNDSLLSIQFESSVKIYQPQYTSVFTLRPCIGIVRHPSASIRGMAEVCVTTYKTLNTWLYILPSCILPSLIQWRNAQNGQKW